MILPLALLAARVALVVGVDDDAYDAPGPPGIGRLCAAEQDVRAVDTMLDAAGFARTDLLRGKATRAAVTQGLRDLAAKAGEGADVFFYFSGRGATSNDDSLEPTLVPADGKKASPAGDVPMSLVEEMARKATEKGSRVTVVVDACFFPVLGRGRSLETRLYKPIRKCRIRGARGVRADLWRGPGVFLCPSGGRGAAYEWLAAAPDHWTSAFTDVLTGAAMSGLLLGRAPEVRSLVADAGAYFRSRVGAGYLDGMRVQVPEGATDRGYGLPFLTSAPVPPPLPALAGVVKALRERQRTLRVAVVADDGLDAARRRALQTRIAALKAPLERTEGVRLVSEQYDGSPDCVLSATDENGLTLGFGEGADDVSKVRGGFSGPDPAAVVANGLGTYLENKLLAKRLWSLAAAIPESDDWTPKAVSEVVPKGGRLGIDFETKERGYVYLMNRDDRDGVASLFFPNVVDNRPFLPPGRGSQPTIYKNTKDSTPGRSALLAVFVPAGEDTLGELPAYDRKLSSDESNRRFDKAVATHLRALLARLESGEAKPRVRRLSYTIPE